MDTIKVLGKLVGLVAFSAMLVLLFAWAAVFIIWMIVAALVIYGVAHVMGWPIRVTRDGELIGHLRRGKFYPK